VQRAGPLATTAVLVLLSLCLRCSRAPELPDPDLSGMEPQVVRLLVEAREAVRAQPDSGEAWGELGSLYDAHLLTDLAETCYRRAHELAPAEFKWVYLLAVARELQGADVAELTELFGQAAELAPDYAPLRVRLGDALWRRNRYEEAREELRRAVEMAPDSAMAHRRLGQVILTIGDAREAVRHLVRSVELEPQDLAAHSALARALMRTGETERARAIRERARGLEPVTALQDPVYGEQVFMRNMSSSGAFARGTAAVRQGAYEQAIRDLTLVLELRPDDASAHYWIGTAHQGSGRAAPAVNHLSRAVELDPAMAKARRQLGTLLTLEGRYADAVEHYERAAALEPLDADAHYGLGLAYEALGRPAAARRHFEAATRLASGQPSPSPQP
jgi:Flp pilus assembly protein TadD